ncbi:MULTISPECIES: GNAT family N-acetyltransferase [unclassified Desulfovibrio]|uniref:GNAT family N-acetyltransferase n=1 Tax=unclassified Desulfovibrio TaxID=2593640 RepID=UPI0013EBFE23|nr:MULTISPECIES: GNAT family N-acetyltransferase [unclassified Desulfovibrio]
MNYSYRRTKFGDDTIIDQVVSLADSNKKTLGFLPESAIRERCEKGEVFVCLIQNELIGYILFSHSKRNHVIRIHHLCIEKDKRNNGLAKLIFKNFLKNIQNAYFIELYCREDYHMDRFWHHLGFNIIKACEGRATNELSILHLYRYQIQKNLINIIEDLENRPKVLLDASIVLEMNREVEGFTESNSLLMYFNDVVFFVAPVIYKYIERQRNEYIKTSSIDKANYFKTLPFSTEKMDAARSSIQSEFPAIKESDRDQLACAITNKVNFFITRDGQLLNEKVVQRFADDYNIMIYSPAEFLHNIDFILNREAIKTSLLPTTLGKLVDIFLDEAELCDKFLNTSKGERKYLFIEKIKNNVKNAKLKSIIISNRDFGIIYYSIECNILRVHLLRTNIGCESFAKSATFFILEQLIQIATQKYVSLIIIEDVYANLDIGEISKGLGFFNNKKISLRYIGKASKYLDFVEDKLPDWAFSELKEHVQPVSEAKDIYSQVRLERNFSPAKFTDIDIPAYIIPIRVQWAKDLISPAVIDQHELFASSTSNVLMHELNVYFTGTKTRISAPSRILWYITNCNNKYRETKYIIASSYLDEVYTGSKGDIFKKFWKIGVYKWKDINKNSFTTCKALLFSRTEIFPNKVSYEFMKDVIKRHMGKGLTAISAVTISQGAFFEIYKQGYNNE